MFLLPAEGQVNSTHLCQIRIAKIDKPLCQLFFLFRFRLVKKLANANDTNHLVETIFIYNRPDTECVFDMFIISLYCIKCQLVNMTKTKLTQNLSLLIKTASAASPIKRDSILQYKIKKRFLFSLIPAYHRIKLQVYLFRSGLK